MEMFSSDTIEQRAHVILLILSIMVQMVVLTFKETLVWEYFQVILSNSALT